MAYDCEIRNATAITPQGRERLTIGISDGRIAALLQQPSSAAGHVITADGLFVLPGMVDEHVHFMDPGATEREDFIHGSSAAAVGGVTTVIEHTHSHPVLTPADLTEKRHYLEKRAVVDYGLTAHVFPHTVDQAAEVWAAGATLLKVFTCTTHGVAALPPDDLLRLFRLLPHDARVLAHCEDERMTAANEQRLRRALRSDYGVIVEWRSAEAELVAVNMVALLARLTGARVTIAHASQPAVVDLVLRERALGAQLSVETCPQYLLLDSDAVRTHGPTRKFTPPAREPPAPEQLWACLANGDIDLIATDHAPATLEQKHSGDIWSCPFGLPGVETTLPLLLDAVNAGRLTLEQVVRRYSEAPARLLGLYPRKGAIRVGADADLVLVDMSRERILRDQDIISKAGWTPYAGRRVRGLPVCTLVRGTIVAQDGRVTAEPGTGRFVNRI